MINAYYIGVSVDTELKVHCVVEWDKGSPAGTIEAYQKVSLSSRIIYAMPTKWYMHADWHKYYVNIKFGLNWLNNGQNMSCRVGT